MGAIIKLRKMPSKCSECPFADEEVKHCGLTLPLPLGMGSVKYSLYDKNKS